MDVIETIKKDKAYLKCKMLVKTWEREFKTKYSRTPSKFDIKEAPAKIKYAYKKYFQLKSTALENSLSICDVEEENVVSPEPVRHFESLSHECCSQSEELPELPSGLEIQMLLSTTKSENAIKHQSPLMDNLSKKLFQNRKFSIRNPRKGFFSKSQTRENKETKQSSDNEKENSIKNFSEQSSPIKEVGDVIGSVQHIEPDCIDVKSISKVIESEPKVRQVNLEWLKRITGTPIDKIVDNNDIKQFGLSNVRISNLKPCDYIENSESEEEDKSIDKLKPALKKRKYDDNLNDKTVNRLNKSLHDGEESKANVSKINTKKLSLKSSKKKQNKKEGISKSFDGTEPPQPPNISEYLPFGLEKELTPRHNNISDILKIAEPSIVNQTSTSKVTDSKDFNKIESKIRNGTLNDNYVKINIEKKVFVRGKKNINFSKYKKQQWKDKKALNAGMEFPDSGKINCFKCGLTGHMARYCTAHKGDTLLPLESYDENDLPSLDDMQKLVSRESKNCSTSGQFNIVYKPTTIPDTVLKLLETQENISCVKPIYSDHLQETSKEIYEALAKFGHDKFRAGQEQAIKRILCGMSTLLILSTGSGKSLCYQLPAYIYSQHFKCITLVISPLVSLMEDQVLSMPEFLKAGCLHTNQPPTQRRKIIQCIKDGVINILLISPEALISGDSSNGFTSIFKSLPPIAFVCIDEVHCVSQWSHNFRPSYLMISRVIREKLKVNCILGLTATASQRTIKSVISHIAIPDGMCGVITNPTLPVNLCLSVSFEKDKDRALVTFLASERIRSYNSIIVYCIRRDECERVAAMLRSCLQEPHKINMEQKNLKRKRMSYVAEAYHAGMSAAQRKKIQKHFMDGTIRIIVATVAFGMGINKSDIRCIIHYNLPSSFESYVQEIGRAGRDNQNAYCHVLMNNSNNDKNELLKHIYANTIDRPTIRKLLQKVFLPCECATTKIVPSSPVPSTSAPSFTARCKGHEVGIPIDSTVEELDLPSENIATLLCYVELHPKNYIKVLNNAYVMCKISSYGGPNKILEAAKACSPLAMAYLLEKRKDSNVISNNIFEFNVIEVAAAIGWESGMVKYHLKNLEWITEGDISKRSLLKVEFNTLGFRIKAPGDLNAIELDEILDDLHKLVLVQEKTMLLQLEEINQTLSSLGHNYSIENGQLTEQCLVEKSNLLKAKIKEYFQRNESLSKNVSVEARPLDIDLVTSDVRALIASYKDCNFTGRSIARIFQGISSPNYPAIVWGRCKFWRSHIHEDFYGIMKIATQQIIQSKML